MYNYIILLCWFTDLQTFGAGVILYYIVIKSPSALDVAKIVSYFSDRLNTGEYLLLWKSTTVPTLMFTYHTVWLIDLFFNRFRTTMVEIFGKGNWEHQIDYSKSHYTRSVCQLSAHNMWTVKTDFITLHTNAFHS